MRDFKRLAVLVDVARFRQLTKIREQWAMVVVVGENMQSRQTDRQLLRRCNNAGYESCLQIIPRTSRFFIVHWVRGWLADVELRCDAMQENPVEVGHQNKNLNNIQ